MTKYNIIQKYVGDNPETYATKDTLAEALNLVNFIRSSCEQVIAQTRIGFLQRQQKNTQRRFLCI